MRAIVFTACLALAFAGPSAEAESPPKPGSGFEVERYEVRLAPDLTAKTLTGSTRITVRATDDGVRSLAFSPNAMTVASARAGGAPVAVNAGEKALVFVLPKPLARGRSATLEVTYSGKPRRGVVWGEGWAHTSYWACDWMICNIEISSPACSTRPASSSATGVLTGQGSNVAPERRYHDWRRCVPPAIPVLGSTRRRAMMVCARQPSSRPACSIRSASAGETPIRPDRSRLLWANWMIVPLALRGEMNASCHSGRS